MLSKTSRFVFCCLAMFASAVACRTTSSDFSEKRLPNKTDSDKTADVPLPAKPEEEKRPDLAGDEPLSLTGWDLAPSKDARISFKFRSKAAASLKLALRWTGTSYFLATWAPNGTGSAAVTLSAFKQHTISQLWSGTMKVDPTDRWTFGIAGQQLYLAVNERRVVETSATSILGSGKTAYDQAQDAVYDFDVEAGKTAAKFAIVSTCGELRAVGYNGPASSPLIPHSKAPFDNTDGGNIRFSEGGKIVGYGCANWTETMFRRDIEKSGKATIATRCHGARPAYYAASNDQVYVMQASGTTPPFLFFCSTIEQVPIVIAADGGSDCDVEQNVISCADTPALLKGEQDILYPDVSPSTGRSKFAIACAGASTKKVCAPE